MIPRISLIAVVLLFGFAPAAQAETLAQQVASIVGHSSFSGSSNGYAIYDLSARRLIYTHNAPNQLKPASNMKLTTTAAALGRMGAGHRLATHVFATGTLSGGVLHGNLYLVGGGDPSFSTGQYADTAFKGAASRTGVLAVAVRSAGIHAVTGAVLGDEAYLSNVRTGPYWKASYWQDCAPLSALSVDEDLVNYGSIYSYHDPPLRAAQVFRAALVGNGVKVAGGAGTATRPSTARLIASEQSPPMYRLTQEMDVPSDNYFAEILNRDIARAAGRPGTTFLGRIYTRNYLSSIGVGLAGAELLDGSGLSVRDRLSAAQIMELLLRVHDRPAYAYWFRNSLPVAGVSGTLSHRMLTGPAHGNAHAKTGTLDDASNLSGYVTSRNGHMLVFSLLMNRDPLINVTAAQALQDRIVQTLAGSSPPA
jgi:D-alanyl-D-alanine carboxypeptidase/D-alanyl-D-alanine-endopeptidase (penicillin-binding protein 4)